MSLAEDFDALRRTVYGEARGQPYEGQIAVAWVILNRARHPTTRWWGVGIKGVCYAPMQFSCHNPGDPNKVLCEKATAVLPSFQKASCAAGEALSDLALDPTDGSTHYFTIKAPRQGLTWPPKWAANMRTMAEIGDHRFLR